MEPSQFPVLQKHHISHIADLRVDPELFTVRFRKECSMMQCSSTCCKGGVWADVGERDIILANIPLVHKYMDPEQEHDSTKWFETELVDDDDFPSRKAVGTEVIGKGCVFLDNVGRCALQKAEIGEKDPNLKLKPFYCTAFPITVSGSVLVYDDYMEQTQPQCCSSASADGELDIFDVCAWELEHTVGKEGLEELKRMKKTIANSR